MIMNEIFVQYLVERSVELQTSGIDRTTELKQLRTIINKFKKSLTRKDEKEKGKNKLDEALKNIRESLKKTRKNYDNKVDNLEKQLIDLKNRKISEIKTDLQPNKRKIYDDILRLKNLTPKTKAILLSFAEFLNGNGIALDLLLDDLVLHLVKMFYRERRNKNFTKRQLEIFNGIKKISNLVRNNN